ncbi:hypothetical protein [Paraburkholderia hospita]|nr:hypothetical protein [Paraburkholderia hospita]SEH42492.1 hypothetical protein SAMN05192544_1001426 [Paraburkholderia hospita]
MDVEVSAEQPIPNLKFRFGQSIIHQAKMSELRNSHVANCAIALV